jgi:hypothetical protein
MEDDLLLTEVEWRAVLVGARVLRESGAQLQAADSPVIAAEYAAHAAVLDNLGRRAVVAAGREQGTPDVDREAQR